MQSNFVCKKASHIRTTAGPQGPVSSVLGSGKGQILAQIRLETTICALRQTRMKCALSA